MHSRMPPFTLVLLSCTKRPQQSQQPKAGLTCQEQQCSSTHRLEHTPQQGTCRCTAGSSRHPSMWLAHKNNTLCRGPSSTMWNDTKPSPPLSPSLSHHACPPHQQSQHTHRLHTSTRAHNCRPSGHAAPIAPPASDASAPTSRTRPRNSGWKPSWFVWKKNMAVSAEGVACHRNTNAVGSRMSLRVTAPHSIFTRSTSWGTCGRRAGGRGGRVLGKKDRDARGASCCCAGQGGEWCKPLLRDAMQGKGGGAGASIGGLLCVWGEG